jgi:hypothetical protein
MATHGRTWTKLLVAAGLCIGAWMIWNRIFDDDQSTKRLVNQIWLERLPKNERDMIHGGVLVQHDGERVGVVGHGSRWRLHQELFLWRLEGDKLQTRFPQDGKRFELRVKTWECEGKVPEPFQLCLEMRHGDRVLKFYSHKDWTIDGDAENLPPELAGLVPDPAALLPAARGQEVGEGAESAGPSPFEALLE